MHPRFCGTDGGTGVSAPFGKGMGMKTKRHNQIIEIISNEKIETQEDLIRHLREAGYSVTQATVSRDIKEMGLVKVATKDNTYRYALPAANEHDITETAKLLREDDRVVYGDSGYLGVQKRPEITSNEHFSKIDFRINRRPSSLPQVSDNTIDWERYIENRKSSVRCKVEHVFRIIKCQFAYKKVAYRGLKKNENRLYAMFACANLYSLAIAGRKLSTT